MATYGYPYLQNITIHYITTHYITRNNNPRQDSTVHDKRKQNTHLMGNYIRGYTQ